MKKTIEKIINTFIPKKIDNRVIVFESEGPYDNGWCLYNYAKKQGDKNKYYFLCSAKYKKAMTKQLGKSVIFYGNKNIFSYIKRQVLLNKARLIFYSYWLPKKEFSNKSLFFTHGYSYKLTRKYNESVFSTNCKYAIGSNDLIEYFKKTYNTYNTEFINFERPSHDLLVSNDIKKSIFNKLISRENFNKVILLMVTFKNNENGIFDENLLAFDVDWNLLNDALLKNNSVLVIKLHHKFDNVSFNFLNNYSNIKTIKNKTLFENSLEPTSIMPYCDCFITDYSSAGTDFLLLNKPIGYFVSDLKQFNESETNGLLFGLNTTNYMPGRKIISFTDFLDFIYTFENDINKYEESRKNVSNFFHGSSTVHGKCCKNIYDSYIRNVK